MAIETPPIAPVTERSPLTPSTWMASLEDIDSPLNQPPSAPKPPAATPPTPEPAKPATPAPEPAKPAAQTPQEPANEDEDKEPMPRTAKDWKAFKAARKEEVKKVSTERDAIRTERDSIKSQIDALKKQGPSPELDALKKERDDYDKRLQLVAVEKHPKFQAYFDNKINPKIELAKSIVGAENASRMEQLLKMPDSQYRYDQIKELVATMDGFDQSRIGGIINDLSTIENERKAEIARSEANYEAMMKDTMAKRESAEKTARESVEKEFQTAIERAVDPKNGILFMQRRDGDEAWNKGVEERMAAAKDLVFGKTDPATISRAAICAVNMPLVLTEYTRLDGELKAAQAQVKALTAASPGIPAAGGEKSGDGRIVKPGSTPQQAMKDWMDNLRDAIP